MRDNPFFCTLRRCDLRSRGKWLGRLDGSAGPCLLGYCRCDMQVLYWRALAGPKEGGCVMQMVLTLLTLPSSPTVTQDDGDGQRVTTC